MVLYTFLLLTSLFSLAQIPSCGKCLANTFSFTGLSSRTLHAEVRFPVLLGSLEVALCIQFRQTFLAVPVNTSLLKFFHSTVSSLRVQCIVIDIVTYSQALTLCPINIY